MWSLTSILRKARRRTGALVNDAAAAIQPDSARGREVTPRDPRISRWRARRPPGGAPRGLLDGFRCAIQPSFRRARLDWHDLAQALRRWRFRRVRTLRGERRIVGGRRAGLRALDRRSAKRAHAAALRH